MNYDFEKIKEHYTRLNPMIFEQAKKRISAWVSPYSSLIDWPSMFSPIETQAWQALRGFGHCPMYPQYPVDRFFVDFGNPVTKIALECDGKQWHLDKEKDKQRDEKLFKKGWVVYRVLGKDCFRIEEDYDELEYKNDYESDGILHNYYQTIEGVVKAIALFHFRYRTYNKYVNEYELAAECLLSRISFQKEKYQKRFRKIIANRIKKIPPELKVRTDWLRC